MTNEFNGLDDYLNTGHPNHFRSLGKLRERVREIENVLGIEELHHWSFSDDVNKSNELNNEPFTVFEIVREAGLSYVIGSFDSCTVLCSIASEKLLRFIMVLNGIMNFVKLPDDFDLKKKAIEVDTVLGKEYYAYMKGRLLHMFKDENGNLKAEDLESLFPMIEKIEGKGFDISDLEETIDKGAGPNLYVLRRDTTVHGNFTALGLGQQIYDIRVGKPVNPSDMDDYFVWHRKTALDQYKRTCRFINKTFEKFDKNYPPTEK